MILTDREIKLSMAAGQIDIDPAPDADSYASTSVDLTLAPLLRIYKAPVAGALMVVDPSTAGFSASALIESLTDKREIDPAEGYKLPQNQFVLAWTREKINLKDTLASLLELKARAHWPAWGLLST